MYFKKAQLSSFFLGTLLFFSTTFFAQTSFQTGIALNIESDARVLAVGDINNDGREDIVAATGSDPFSDSKYKIFVYLQDSLGVLEVGAIYPYPELYPGLDVIIIEDVNNDSLNDLIIGYSDSIGIFYQNNLGSLDPLQSYYSGTNVYSLRTGDLNNDGLTDIVVSHWHWVDEFIRVFYQSNTGFSTQQYPSIGGERSEIEIGDLNSDGLDDVLYLAGQNVDGVHVYTQNASGTLDDYVSYYPPGGNLINLNGIALGDLNNDGSNDVVATKSGNFPSSKIFIWYQDTLTNLLQAPIELAAHDIPSPIDVADFNCDGKLEFFTTHSGFSSLSIYHQDSNGAYNDYDLYSFWVEGPLTPHSMACGDINNDGMKDIVSKGFNKTIQLAYNNSLPINFDTIILFIEVDTFYTEHIIEVSYFTETTIDSIPNYLITQTDSFSILKEQSIDSIRIDSTYKEYGTICNNQIQNTIVSSNSFSNELLIYCDTVFISTTIDSVYFPPPPPPEICNDESFQIFPNPTNRLINIHTLDTNCKEDPILVKIYDTIGRNIQSTELSRSNSEHEIDLGIIADGIYYLELKSNEFTTLKKIVKHNTQ